VTISRVGQEAIEVLLQAAAKGHLSEQVAESLLQATPRARHGQQSIEVLRSVILIGSAVGSRPVLTLYVCG
jgi:hypothetical protein